MSTRKRSRKVDESDFANTQPIQTKVPRKNKTTTNTDTDTDAVDAGLFQFRFLSFSVAFVLNVKKKQPLSMVLFVWSIKTLSFSYSMLVNLLQTNTKLTQTVKQWTPKKMAQQLAQPKEQTMNRLNLIKIQVSFPKLLHSIAFSLPLSKWLGYCAIVKEND